MPTIVDFPTVVKDALAIFGDVFDTEPARHHFAEYLTGLMVAEHKTVSGINREFAVTTDQSCLNRWLTEVEWDVKALNDRRLEWLQGDPKMRYSARGVIAIDNSTVVFWVVRGKPSPCHNHRLLGKQRGEEIVYPLPEFEALVGIQDQPLNKCPRLLTTRFPNGFDG